MPRRERYDPDEMVRCGGCERLVRKLVARPGPGGRLYGPACLNRALELSRTDPLAAAREHAAELARERAEE